MPNQFRVCWLHHSKVYHRADFRDWRGGSVYSPCGHVLSCPRFRCQEGTESEARKFGLRRCRICFDPRYLINRRAG